VRSLASVDELAGGADGSMDAVTWSGRRPGLEGTCAHLSPTTHR
jgi:hypothetical protein